MTTRRTSSQTASNPTEVEAKTKAFDARRALWLEEDAREEERLRAVGKPLTDALLNTVPMQGDLQWKDQARLVCKVVETFNFQKYFPMDESGLSILHHLMDELEEYSHKLVDPATPDQYIKDLPLEDLKGMLIARGGQLCTWLDLLRTALTQLADRENGLGGCIPPLQNRCHPTLDGDAGPDLGPEILVCTALTIRAPGETSLHPGKRHSCDGHVPVGGEGHTGQEAGPLCGLLYHDLDVRNRQRRCFRGFC